MKTEFHLTLNGPVKVLMMPKAAAGGLMALVLILLIILPLITNLLIAFGAAIMIALGGWSYLVYAGNKNPRIVSWFLARAFTRMPRRTSEPDPDWLHFDP